ncbi:STAS domain-containing protein [Streptomyces sp. NBC_00199]|uniref:STAS domain-containing protein n=1 Tax=Streptomyces sp. NBC_00199 TaxID=2975678 RepID=UPI0022562CEB|nr:STAS domain-containing protein [Streptomyces sp. NBC_00199]MCX5265760.1 STAS domain-containing protein [Streptomyces sp. NBC_00199]
MAEGEMADSEHSAQPGQLSVASTATDGIRVITVAGEIDFDTIEPLRQALDVPDLPQPRIVIDVHQVTFMDSTGINLLITAYHAITGAGGWIRLAAPTEAVMHTLQLVGVDTLIECRETLREALGT